MEPTNTPTPATHGHQPDPSSGPGVWIQATHQLRRGHNGSVISTHCGTACAAQALESLTLAELIGPNSPGPLQRVRGELIDLATGQAVGFTTGMTPLNGEPTDVHSWP